MSFASTDRDREHVVHAGRSRERGEEARRAHVLVVDDDDGARGALEKLLRADGFSTSTAAGGEAALAEAKRAMPDIVLTDLHMEPVHGVELCRRLHEMNPDLPVIIMTAFSDTESAIASLRAGAEDYLTKPLNYDAVLWRVERAIARREAKLEQAHLREYNDELYRSLNERLVVSAVREQEHAEALAKQSAQLNALLQNLKEGVAIADPSGRMLMINDAARDILGFGDLCTIDAINSLEAHDLKGQPLPTERRPLMRALRGEQFVDYEVLRIRPNGEPRRVVSTGSSVKDAKGDVALAIVVFRDVTELRRLEHQRDEYLALISHDLCNPLTSILMLADTLKRSMGKKGHSEEMLLAERAERNVIRMRAMLDELTDATSLEHAVALRLEACDLRELVANVVDSLDDARAGRITIETDDGAPHVVLVDAARLERVVANLLTNALKYSADDAPVNARLVRKGSTIELDVVDRGIGIAPESVKMLFARYYRTTAGKAHTSGLGLGLYIAHMIVEAHGGRIDVFSEIGKGTTFTLVLPALSASRLIPAPNLTHSGGIGRRGAESTDSSPTPNEWRARP